MNEGRSIRVLIVESDLTPMPLAEQAFNSPGFQLTVTRSHAEGLKMYDPRRHDVVVVDQHLPGVNALAMLRELAGRSELPPLVLIASPGDEGVIVDALKLGASGYVLKGSGGSYLTLLPTVLRQALDQHNLVAEKQQVEAALRAHTSELEARNAELDAFAETVAHDLKNPIGTMLAYVEMIMQTCDELTDDELCEHLRQVSQAGLKMRNIVDELLLLAEVRKAEVAHMPLDMEFIVDSARARLDYLIAETGAELVEPRTWPVALGYGPWVEEVWVNYISNAMRYGGQPPRIELGYDLPEQAEAAPRMVRFWVRDNGLGVSPDVQTRLFAPFTRLDQVRARGHGLGLSIVHRIVAKLGGRVGVESQVGEGSTFYFTLPAGS